MTEDGQEAIACNLPGNLKNATVVTKTLVPAVKVRFRMLDMATKKPIANQKIGGPVSLLTPNSRSPVNLRFYLSYTSDENGEVVAAAAPLGEYEELEYNLQIFYDSEREAKTIQGNTKFSPRKAGETVDLGDILVENGIAASKENERRETTVRGSILMPDGTPAKNATLVAHSRAITNSAVHGHHAQANDNGEYRIELMQGQELFTAQAYVSTFPDGVAPSYKAVLDGKEIFTPLVSEIKAFFCPEKQLTTQDFTLQEAFPLQGTVRYADGIPVKNAMVFISQKDFTAEDTRFQIISKSGPIFARCTGTDAEGKFQIYLPTFEYEVYVADGQGPSQTVEVGPDKMSMVELVMKNRNFVRPIRGDGSPLFQKVPQMANNMVFWRSGPPDAEGKPTTLSIGSGGSVNEEGNLEMCLEEGANLIFITNDNYTEGYAGEIPNNLKNLEVFPIQLVPLAQVQLRLVDVDGKPLSAQ